MENEKKSFFWPDYIIRGNVIGYNLWLDFAEHRNATIIGSLVMRLSLLNLGCGKNFLVMNKALLSFFNLLKFLELLRKPSKVFDLSTNLRDIIFLEMENFFNGILSPYEGDLVFFFVVTDL